MKLTRYEKFLCKAVDVIYISGSLLILFISMIFALKYL